MYAVISSKINDKIKLWWTSSVLSVYKLATRVTKWPTQFPWRVSSYKIHCNILNLGNWGWEIQFSTCIWSQSIGAIWFWEETGENTFFSYPYCLKHETILILCYISIEILEAVWVWNRWDFLNNQLFKNRFWIKITNLGGTRCHYK
jgi:hypothetical protein